jgi:hypothetical protein
MSPVGERRKVQCWRGVPIVPSVPIETTQVRGFFETHGASRFEGVGASIDQRVINRAGFYRAGMDGISEFLVLPEAFRRDLCAGFDLKVATQCLLALGWIVPGGDGRPTQKPRLPGIGLARVYVFTNKWADSSTLVQSAENCQGQPGTRQPVGLCKFLGLVPICPQHVPSW